jgi:hypothetical protein
VKDREFRIAFGWKNCSRVPKRAARSDDGKRNEFWWRKPVKPRETGAIVGNTWDASSRRVLCKHYCAKEANAQLQLSLRRVEWLEGKSHGGPCAGTPKLLSLLLLNISTTSDQLVFSARQTTRPHPPPIGPHGFDRRGLQSVGACCDPAASQQWRKKRCAVRLRIHGPSINSDAAFHPAQASLAAQNFNMPALSPTMTEGNIATWKIKEGTTNLH